MFGWGAKDETTKEERKDWRDNAKQQMDKGKPVKDKSGKGKQDDPPRHANKSSWW